MALPAENPGPNHTASKQHGINSSEISIARDLGRDPNTRSVKLTEQVIQSQSPDISNGLSLTQGYFLQIQKLHKLRNATEFEAIVSPLFRTNVGKSDTKIDDIKSSLIFSQKDKKLLFKLFFKNRYFYKNCLSGVSSKASPNFGAQSSQPYSFLQLPRSISSVSYLGHANKEISVKLSSCSPETSY